VLRADGAGAITEEADKGTKQHMRGKSREEHVMCERKTCPTSKLQQAGQAAKWTMTMEISFDALEQRELG
jgi:hypothetical protein